MRKYFLELFAIGLVDSEGRINTEHMTSDALMTAMKTMEELTQMKMDRLVLETTMEMILCMFESCDTEEFTEILGKLLGGKQTSKVTAHLEALEELLTEEEYSSFLAEYLGYLTVNVAEFIRSTSKTWNCADCKLYCEASRSKNRHGIVAGKTGLPRNNLCTASHGSLFEVFQNGTGDLR